MMTVDPKDKLVRLNACLGPEAQLGDLSELAQLPVTRKDDVLARQAKEPPLADTSPIT